MTSSDKLTLIILEGPDKVGKSTIYQLLRRATGYGPLVIDRFIGSNIVYDLIYGRDTSTEKYFKAERDLLEKFDVVCFCLTCDPAILTARIESLEKGQDLYIALENFKKADHLFDGYFERSPIEKGSIIDTSTLTPIETVERMIHYMKEIGYETTQWEENLKKLRG